MYSQEGRALGRYFQRKRKLQILNDSQVGEERSGEGKCWDSPLRLVSDNRMISSFGKYFLCLAMSTSVPPDFWGPSSKPRGRTKTETREGREAGALLYSRVKYE